MPEGDGFQQVNTRVPPDAKRLVQRVGKRLRTDPAFAERLTVLLDALEGAGGLPSIDDRVARLEREVRELRGNDSDRRTALGVRHELDEL